MNRTLIEKYAELIVKMGVNLQQGDTLVINATFDGVDLARALCKAAYEAGAKRVQTMWNDEQIDRLHYTYQTVETLTDFPQWFVDRYDAMVDEKACYVAILAEDPEGFRGVDPMLLSEVSKARHRVLKRYYDASMSNRIRWCLCAVPCDAWAQKIFPELPADQADAKLWDHIVKTMRLDCDDSVGAWRAHVDRLNAVCDRLNKEGLKQLRYRNSIGTDFTIGLPDGYYFSGGHELSEDGVPFTANMPTEEVFTAPHRLSANGTVVASMPLVHNGAVIDRFRLTFENGKITDFDAQIGYDTLKSIIHSDEGSRYLGEVALVPFDSPIQALGTLFYNTLFDENAGCHLAIGEAYPMIRGASDMTPEQKKAAGLNESCVHVDFMIGTRDMTIDGIKKDGSIVPIFRNGNFAF